MANDSQRQYPVIPDLPRGQASEFRILRTMSYDSQDAIQNLNDQLQSGFSGTITFGVTGGTVNGTITVSNGLITAVIPAS